MVGFAEQFKFRHIKFFGKGFIENEEEYDSQCLFLAEVADADHRIEVVPVHEAMAVEIEYLEDPDFLSLNKA